MSEAHTKFMEEENERLRRRLLAEENYNDILRNETEHLEKDRNNLELRVKALEEELASVKAERLHAVSTLSEQVDDLVRDGMADILTRTVNVLRGNPPENGLHSWHDLPERVVQLRNTRDALEAERDELVRIANRLTAERDEARRGLCYEVAAWVADFKHSTHEAESRAEAERRGWDCFKEGDVHVEP